MSPQLAIVGEADPLRVVLGKLPGYRKTAAEQFEARCPAHEDSRASLAVGVGKDRSVLLKCHAGCDLAEVLRALELAPADLFAPKAVERRQVATYPYLDASGGKLFEVVRFEPKDFRQRQPDGKGGWSWSVKGLEKVPYRLPELLAAVAVGASVWIAEGEKDVDALRSQGLVATCNAGGAGKWLPEYSASFRGASAAYVIPDNDAPGELHAQAVAASLAAVVPLVKVVRLPAGVKDAAEWLGKGGNREQLEQLAAKASPYSATSFETVLGQALVDVAARSNSDRANPLSTPAFESAADLFDRDFPRTPWLVQGLLVEQAVSATAGEPKTAKTWSALELAVAVASGTKAFGSFETGSPRRVAVFLVEDDARSTRNRLRALVAGRGADAKVALRNVSVKCRGSLDLLDDKALAWLVASCRFLPERPELLVLDPLRDLHSAKENEADSMAPVMARLRLVRDLLGCAIVFVHHASKSGETTNARRPGQRMRGSGVVHASVDGGLYLSNLETDGATRFESTADVELKAVRGAGQFSLRLDVIDDEGGEAISAKWTVTRGDAAPASDEGLEKAEASVLKFLRFEFTNAMGATRPLASRALREKTGLRNDRVLAALAQLAAEEKVTQIYKGKKALGWVYLPTESEKPTSQKTASGIATEAPEAMPKDRFPPLIGEAVDPTGSGVTGSAGSDPAQTSLDVPTLKKPILADPNDPRMAVQP